MISINTIKDTAKLAVDTSFTRQLDISLQAQLVEIKK